MMLFNSNSPQNPQNPSYFPCQNASAVHNKKGATKRSRGHKICGLGMVRKRLVPRVRVSVGGRAIYGNTKIINELHSLFVHQQNKHLFLRTSNHKEKKVKNKV